MVKHLNNMVEQWNSVVEQCRIVWWNIGTEEQCDGTVWSNSVEQHGGTVWHSLVEHCGTVWWNSVERYGGTVDQCGGTV